MRDYTFDILDALKAPVLTFAPQWTIPERVLKIIPLARMKALMLHEEMATYAEASAYIMTRGHEAPLDHDWTDIFTHVSCKMCEEYFGEDRWDAVQAPRELNDWQQRQLNDLRRHLYDKRRKLLKQRLKDEQRISPTHRPVDETGGQRSVAVPVSDTE